LSNNFAGLHLASSSTNDHTLPYQIDSQWLADSGATSHMTSDPNLLRSMPLKYHSFGGPEDQLADLFTLKQKPAILLFIY
jgi:hypothetical protein